VHGEVRQNLLDDHGFLEPVRPDHTRLEQLRHPAHGQALHELVPAEGSGEVGHFTSLSRPLTQAETARLRLIAATPAGAAAAASPPSRPPPAPPAPGTAPPPAAPRPAAAGIEPADVLHERRAILEDRMVAAPRPARAAAARPPISAAAAGTTWGARIVRLR